MEQRQGSKPEYPITRKLWLEERQQRVGAWDNENATSSRGNYWDGELWLCEAVMLKKLVPVPKGRANMPWTFCVLC